MSGMETEGYASDTRAGARTGRTRAADSPRVERTGSGLAASMPSALDSAGRRARTLGWFSVGLGLTQLLAPRVLSRLIGVDHQARRLSTMRAIGIRELAAGCGILASRRPAGWLWARVAGDLMDLALLGRALTSSRSDGRRLPLAIAAVAGVTVLDVWTSRQLSGKQAARPRPSATEPVQVRGTITIDRPPADIYAFWRDFHNLPRFMTDLQSVEVRDQGQSHWKALGPGGRPVEWDAAVSEDRPNELIAWRTTGGDLANLVESGEVRFLHAPGGRGTEVHLVMNFKPPRGLVENALGQVLRKVPEHKVANDLRRFKQVMEVGEIVESEASVHGGPHPARPAGGKGGSGRLQSRGA